MKIRSTHRFFLFPLLGLALFGCESSSTGSGGGGNPSGSRFKVSDSLLGRWIGLPGTSSQDDTFNISKDSLSGAWTDRPSGTTHKSIVPNSTAINSVKFYGYNGRMGVTNGMTAEDNVEFEYQFSGDTLLVELQGFIPEDGKVNRADTNFTHAWRKR